MPQSLVDGEEDIGEQVINPSPPSQRKPTRQQTPRHLQRSKIVYHRHHTTTIVTITANTTASMTTILLQVLALFFDALQESIAQGGASKKPSHVLYFTFRRKHSNGILCYEVHVPGPTSSKISSGEAVRLHLLDEGGSVVDPVEPNCKVLTSVGAMVSIITGQTKAPVALLRGMLKVEGDRSLFGSDVHIIRDAMQLMKKKDEVDKILSVKLQALKSSKMQSSLPSSQHLGEGDNRFQGPLLKQGYSGMKRWRLRWVVICGDKLSYYENGKAPPSLHERPRGTIRIRTKLSNVERNSVTTPDFIVMGAVEIAKLGLMGREHSCFSEGRPTASVEGRNPPFVCIFCVTGFLPICID
jgi:hypothetical protein